MDDLNKKRTLTLALKSQECLNQCFPPPGCPKSFGQTRVPWSNAFQNCWAGNSFLYQSIPRANMHWESLEGFTYVRSNLLDHGNILLAEDLVT